MVCGEAIAVNATKTEILWFGSETNLRKLLPANRVISVGQSVIQPVTVVLDLGVLIDGELSMRQHVTKYHRHETVFSEFDHVLH